MHRWISRDVVDEIRWAEQEQHEDSLAMESIEEQDRLDREWAFAYSNFRVRWWANGEVTSAEEAVPASE